MSEADGSVSFDLAGSLARSGHHSPRSLRSRVEWLAMSEADGSVSFDSPDPWLAQGTIRLVRCARESNGGGAGICTRVRKYILAGIYGAYPPLSCRSRREEAEQPPGTNPEKSRR
jgi:hypothetical protein